MTAGDQAATRAIKAGHGSTWERLVSLATRFEAIHWAGQMLRQTGGMGNLLYPCPEGIGAVFLDWQAAGEGLERFNQVVGPLRVRYGVDRDWLPGLWTPADHAAHAPKAKPVPMLQRLRGWVEGPNREITNAW